MGRMKRIAQATLIGDLVGSRAASDRDALHARLQAVLEAGNAALHPVTPLRITVGDEYQGAFATVGEALHASLWLRLELLPTSDQRHGIGWGDVGVLEDVPRVEDGPGWWAARDAIVAVEADSERSGLRHARARYHLAEGVAGPQPGPINAALLCRDQLIGAGDDRTVRLLRGLLNGRSKSQLAAQEGISASAVSQRVGRAGITVLLAADKLLQEVA